MTDKLNRREFLAGVAAGGAALILGGCAGNRAASSSNGQPKLRAKAGGPSILAVAEKGTPEENTRAAVKALGGMEGFVKKGDKVAIKANIGWLRTPLQAANTNPDVVRAVVQMCQEAGAKEIVLVEHTCDKPAQQCFDLSGIKAALEGTGVRIISGDNEGLYRTIEIPKGKVLSSDKVFSDVLDADVLINIPIAKVHSAALVTLGMKNLMGINWNRQAWHQSSDFHQCIADFSSAVRPALTILDANRILLTNGPKGPGQTRDPKIVAASADPVALDSFGATLFGKKGTDVPYIVKAHELGLGEIDLAKVKRA